MEKKITMVEIDDKKLQGAIEARERDCRGVTLVAFYREKPDPLSKLIQEVHGMILDGLGEKYEGYFEPYQVPNIHATLIGLEGRLEGGEIINDNLAARVQGVVGRQYVPTVGADGFLRFFKQGYAELGVQLGGYKPGDWNPYSSKPPYDRTFDIQSNGLFVMMGWTVRATEGRKEFQPLIFALRKHCERFKVVHKYHIVPTDGDNDLFFALGSLRLRAWKKASDSERSRLQERLTEVRDRIRRWQEDKPTVVPISREHIKVVAYTRTTLDKPSFCQPVTSVTPDELKSLYEA